MLHQLKLILEIPAGAAALIPSALVTHGNSPILPSERRYTMTAYTSASFFQFAENGFESIGKWDSEAEAIAFGKEVFKEGLGRLPTIY